MRFTLKQKQFLQQRFEAGAETGIKFNPTQTAQDMRKLQGPGGRAYFQPSEYLTWQQIASFWSRMNANPRASNRQQPPDQVNHDEYVNDPTIPTQHADIWEELENQGWLNITNITDIGVTTEATVESGSPPPTPPPDRGRKRTGAECVTPNRDRPDDQSTGQRMTQADHVCDPGPSKKPRKSRVHDELFF